MTDYTDTVFRLLSELKSSKYADEIAYLQNYLSINDEELLNVWLFWDTKIGEYSNEIYSSENMRFVMYLHNLLKSSWHEKRQQLVLDILNKINPNSICDIGFGSPQKYLHYYKDINILLTDYEETAISFAKVVIDNWKETNSVRFQKLNMDTDSLPKDYEVYLFQDSIEHANNPTEVLKSYVTSVSKNTHFIFSLPIEIESPVPEHHICWRNEDEVCAWVESCGLNVKRIEPIKMDKDVDIFATSLHPDFREVIIHAQKLHD